MEGERPAQGARWEAIPPTNARGEQPEGSCWGEQCKTSIIGFRKFVGQSSISYCLNLMLFLPIVPHSFPLFYYALIYFYRLFFFSAAGSLC